MNVFIKLTSSSPNTGPFNLYSDVDGYVTPFETNIARAVLLSGYISTVVPAFTTLIRITSEGSCGSYTTVTIQHTTTTTTSTTLPSTTTTTSTLPTTTTTTSSSSTTTTTTTTGLPVRTILVAKSTTDYAGDLCGEEYTSELVDELTAQGLYFQSGDTVPSIGQQLYTDAGVSIPFVGDAEEWGAIILFTIPSSIEFNNVITIAVDGTITSITDCSAITTTTTTTLLYHMDMCVNSTTYDEPNEVSIPISFSPTIINSPTKAGYNYFFLSIPTIYTFTLKDSLGTDITSSMSLDPASGTGGTDIRPGYFNNYIYKSDDTFATDFSTEFTLTLS